MEFNKGKYLKILAMQKGMDHAVEGQWAPDMTDDELARLYISGLDFCIRNDFPSNEYILSNFGRAVLRRNGIYVSDGNINESGLCGTVVIQGDSAGELHFGHYDAATVWVRHGSELDIDVHGNAWVFVHVLDKAFVSIHQNGDSRVTVKRHSGDTSVVATGNVKLTGMR